ncbi:hypothetical protein DB32_006049 [Sandaracinus amylolyticus]|uniref:Uncharacterized protein n=1 Tax=Sandaracinus amylolyticus TaxID=927083 RepID=A0A0F6W6P9_9BACT|nr:hypothetical protein DB32_006049 [Sandaracinus amylolyticus]
MLGGSGALALGLAALLRVLPGAIKRISDALAVAWEKRSAAQLARAEARRIEAQTERDEVQLEIAREQTNVELFKRYEDRLKAAELRAERAEAEARALRQWAQRVFNEMRRRGMTPPEMPEAIELVPAMPGEE